MKPDQKKAPRAEKKEKTERPGLWARLSAWSRKKKILAFLLVSAILAGAGISVYFLTRSAPSVYTSDRAIVLFPVDYDKDILKDQVYLSFDRDLYYSANGVTTSYNEDNIGSASRECRFFYEFLQTVIRGEYERFPSYFYEPEKHQAKFTMQMLYRISVSAMESGEEEIDGKTVPVLNFSVRCAIHRNNGTYRSGVRSDALTTQVFQLIDTNDGYRIYRVLDVVMSDESR